jgi:hypothetical protein
MLFEQRYLELMEQGSKIEAIQILQKELLPRCENDNDKSKMHQLAQLLMCNTERRENNNIYQSELREKANWKGSELEGRTALLEKIQTMMPSTAMLQPNRLEHLVKQAVSHQVQNCKYHNVFTQKYSLLEDHVCSKQMLPSKCIATLTKHKDEVWSVKFSITGKRLASMGKDNLIYIWQFTKIIEN